MFSKRYDGRRVRNLDVFDMIIPYIMKTRTDSQNSIDFEIPCDPLDEYIRLKKAEGKDYNYMKIILSAITRVIAQRPALNRFVMRNRIYTRPKIWISFALHKSLREETAETTVKLCFEGTETIEEVSEAIDKIIAETAYVGASSLTDKLVGVVMSIPSFLLRFVINTLMAMDKFNLLPKAIIEASPFHTTLFITNMKSLGIGAIRHHVYEFGTTGLFLALGKEARKAVPLRGNEIGVRKMLPLSLVMDERFCDGLYFAKSARLFWKYLADPCLLETKLEAKVEDVD